MVIFFFQKESEIKFVSVLGKLKFVISSFVKEGDMLLCISVSRCYTVALPVHFWQHFAFVLFSLTCFSFSYALVLFLQINIIIVTLLDWYVGFQFGLGWVCTKCDFHPIFDEC